MIILHVSKENFILALAKGRLDCCSSLSLERSNIYLSTDTACFYIQKGARSIALSIVYLDRVTFLQVTFFILECACAGCVPLY